MTREQFSELAQRVDARARQNPRRYRRQVFALAALGYGALFAFVALCLVLLTLAGLCLTQEWFWSLAGRDARLFLVWLGVVISLMAALFATVRSLFVSLPVPSGRRVRREDAPALFAAIDEVVAASRAPSPHAVLLSWDFNASVCQRPRFGYFGRTQDYLILGVPLMAALTPAQFQAVLAHEYGHLRGGHGRFGNWVYRLRTTWEEMYRRVVVRQKRSASLIARFLAWYNPLFGAYTHGLSRTQEFEADRWAAEVAGLPVAGEALINLWLRGAQVQEEFWQGLYARANREEQVPQGVFAPLLALVRQPLPRESRRRALRVTLGRATDGLDTHPSPAERLAALGLPSTLAELDSDEFWGDESVEATPAANLPNSAADALLGDRLNLLLDELETGWRVVTRPAWQARFERARHLRDRLETLDRAAAQAPDTEPTEATAWERTCLRLDLAADPTEARAIAEGFAVRWPDHAAGQFALGQILLEAGDEAGIAHLDKAVHLRPTLATEGTEAVATFLRREGRTEEAAERQRQATRHGDVLDAAHAERTLVTAKDHFLPSGLDATQVAALQAHLARHPRVTKAYVARKAVVHHPEMPWYVVVCLFRWRWNEWGSEKRTEALLAEIRQGWQVAGTDDFFFILVEARHHRHKIIRKVRKASGGEVYPPPKPKGRRWWGGRKAAAATPLAAPALTAPALRAPGTSSSPAPAQPAPPPLPTAVPVTLRRNSRPLEALAIGLAALVAICPLGFVGYRLFRKGGAWQKVTAGFASTAPGRRFGPPGKVAEARQPIPRDPLASTEETDRRQRLLWARRTMLDAFDRVGRRNPRWNAPAHAFIEHALPLWAGLHDATVTAEELAPQARAVLRLGCDDPVVLYLAALTEARLDPQSGAAGPLFARAMTGFQNTPYLRGVAMAAATATVADCEYRRDGTGQADPAKQWWLTWYKQALRDGSFSLTEQSVLANFLSYDWGAILFRKNRAACADALEGVDDTQVAAWVRLWLTGKRHLQDGWDARGTTYANEVTAEGWRGLARGLALARRDLTASWQLNPRRPEAAGQMISVTLGENAHGEENPRLWFDRAVSAQIDFEPAYQSFLMTLWPRWGGSQEAIAAFGLNCAETAAYDTGVPLQLDVAAQNLPPGLGYRNPEISAALERMYAGYEADPAQAGRRLFFRNRHARAAELAGRYADAYRLLKVDNFVLSPELSADLADRQELGGYLERIAAYGGPGGEDARMGDDLLARGKPESAGARFQSALTAASGEPRAVVYLQSRLDGLETERRLAGGDWIPFQPKAGPGGVPVGWTSKLGTWRVAPDGALVGQAGASGLMLVNDAKVGADFEIRGELDFLPDASSEQQAGVVFGHPDMDGDDWQSFRLKRKGPDGAIATISCHWYDGPKQPLSVPDHNTFALQSRHGLLTLTVNGVTVFRDQRLAKGQVQDGSVLVGLGGYAHHGNPFSVAYRKLQLRRLTGTALAANH